MNQNDSLLTKNQKTGLIVVGFSFLIGLMVFLVGTGVLILSLSLFGFGVYMFFKKETEIIHNENELSELNGNFLYSKNSLYNPFLYIYPTELTEEQLYYLFNDSDELTEYNSSDDDFTCPTNSFIPYNIFHDRDDDY